MKLNDTALIDWDGDLTFDTGEPALMLGRIDSSRDAKYSISGFPFRWKVRHWAHSDLDVTVGTLEGAMSLAEQHALHQPIRDPEADKD